MTDSEIKSKPDTELTRRIEALRSDFAAHSPSGKPFEHFYCPILLRDEPTKMCQGHIENEKFKGCNAWVPQRADVDAFFGSAIESDMISLIRDRDKDPADLLMSPQKRRRAKPKLVHQGTTIEHYLPKKDAKPAPGHTLTQLVDNGKEIRKLVLKIAPDEFIAKDGMTLEIVIEGDFRASAIAYTIKAAHLTMFKMFGYRYVFSPSGQCLAPILRDFYDQHKPPRKCSEKDVEEHFRKHQNMIAPIYCDDAVLRGTVVDNRITSCFSASNALFAVGVIVRAGPDKFCVFVPGMDVGIDTYFSFIKEPPQSIASRITQFQPHNDDHSGCWVAEGIEAQRFPLNQKISSLEEAKRLISGAEP